MISLSNHRQSLPDGTRCLRGGLVPNISTDITSRHGNLPFTRQKVPDYLHVNHVGRCRNRLLVTCFSDGTLRALDDLSPSWRRSRAGIFTTALRREIASG